MIAMGQSSSCGIGVGGYCCPSSPKVVAKKLHDEVVMDEHAEVVSRSPVMQKHPLPDYAGEFQSARQEKPPEVEPISLPPEEGNVDSWPVPGPRIPREPSYEVENPPEVSTPDPEPMASVPSRRPETASRRLSTQSGDSGKAPLQGNPFPKRPKFSKLSLEFWNKAEMIFSKMDTDNSNAVTKEEALEFFKGAFNKLSAEAMFNEMDVDNSGAITGEEFMAFWVQVRAAGYKESDMMLEIDEILQGGAWVDWKDGRDTSKSSASTFPRRPWLCKLPVKTWNKCRLLFEKIDTDKTMVITPEKAEAHFKGGFKKISTEAMFNEIDLNHHNTITPKEWMNFWKQVKSSGYKQSHIDGELDNLLAGDPWVDWNDGRTT